MSISAYRAVAVNTLPREMWPSAAYTTVVGFIGQAQRAMERGDIQAAHDSLVRAQQVVAVLRGSLQPDQAGISTKLSALYDYVSSELGQANVTKDAARLQSLGAILLPLRDAWEAAGRSAQRGSGGGQG